MAGPAALPDAEAIYVRDGTRFVPTGRARGPWDSEAQHERRRQQRRRRAAVEIRFAAGHWGDPGPATAWMRLRVALIAGEPTTPLARAAAAADFGNGLSAALPWAGWLFINPDLTLYLDRAPTGEWVAVAARTTIRTDGSGLTDSALHDERGPIGRALQALYVAPRGPSAPPTRSA